MDGSEIYSSNGSIIAIAIVGITSLFLWNFVYHKKPCKKLHVDYGKLPHNSLPLRIIASLPDFIRKPLLVKGAKPKPPKDAIDVLGTDKIDPYEKWEILPGKIWGVKYTFLSDPAMQKFLESIIGKLTDEKKQLVIDRVPSHLKETLRQDFEKTEKYDQLSEEEKIEVGGGGDMNQDTFIAKINIGEEEEGLVIYNPCRMHPHFVKWLNNLGKVKYIVSGSSSHTNQLPAAAKLFPHAKIICASAADAKCQAAGMRPADYLYDLRRNITLPKKYLGRGTLEDASKALQGQATLFHVNGDVMTQALFFLVHRHLFEVDIAYVSGKERQREIETGSSINCSKARTVNYLFMNKDVPPIGYSIPMHRPWAMDPTTLFASKLLIDTPKSDGSSCTDMAQSLREILNKISEEGYCEMVHSVHFGQMTTNEFKTGVNDTWRWLDGKSLVDE